MGDVTLRAGAMHLHLRPGWGGRVIALRHATAGDLLVPVTDADFRPENWPRAGAYPLIPFHNRVRGALFHFAGRSACLPAHPDTAPHALHGAGSRKAWETVMAGPDAALLRLNHAGDASWPWRFEAEQRFTLEPDALRVDLALRNLDSADMPAGLGWHPYFPAPARFSHDATTGWPMRGDYLPTGEKRAAADVGGPTQYLSDWRFVTIALPSGAVLRLTASPELRHLVLHAPAGPFACAEPVSHLANALADPPHDPADGMHRLAPGGHFSARLRLALNP